jgi:hypothetical protein
LAALPQQEPSAVAAAAVPQHSPPLAGSAPAIGVSRGALPQQPSASATDSAAAGSPAKPPCTTVESLIIVSLEITHPQVVSTTIGFDDCRNQACTRFR